MHGEIIPDAHHKAEWARLAADAYRLGLNAVGHRFSGAAAFRHGEAMPIRIFDALQSTYREWLIAGFPGFASETLHARGL